MEKPRLDKKFLGIAIPVFAGLFLLVFYWISFSAPSSFPTHSIVVVEQGTGLLKLSMNLEEEGVIRSPFWFRMSAILQGGERGMKAGEYYLSSRQGVFGIAKRIVRGEHEIERVRVTIPEGFTVKKISALFDERFPYFDNQEFEARAPEGYLFPDTYFIPVTATASSTIGIMRSNFIRKIFDLMPEVEESGHSLDEVIIMASILEGEAKTEKDMKIISDILWKRIKIGMPLQVDTSFVYVLGKSTFDLTLEDLEVQSPYNTYKYAGLPPGPISNPGLVSIKAALSPTATPYLYFLTGKDGQMYYSKTHDEHVANKAKYLR